MASGKKEDNPFSFKAFINKREKGKSETKKKKNVGTTSTEMPFPEASEENPFSFKKFVKTSELLKKDNSSSFSSDEELNDPLLLPDPLQRGPGKDLKISDPLEKDDLFSNGSDSENDTNSQTLPVPLPDPLPLLDPPPEHSDNTITPFDMNPFPEVAVLELDDSHHQLVTEVKQLKTENESLKKQLANIEDRYKKERAKSNSLKEELKTLKDKEKKEAKSLEDMVLKVEENLTAATQRAVQAESTISKLRQEVQTLKTQLAQANPQAIHKSYEDLVTGIRDKTNHASQQLKSAAYKADLQIKELCQGVEALKFVSELLENIDSIYEVKH